MGHFSCPVPHWLLRRGTKCGSNNERPFWCVTGLRGPARWRLWERATVWGNDIWKEPKCQASVKLTTLAAFQIEREFLFFGKYLPAVTLSDYIGYKALIPLPAPRLALNGQWYFSEMAACCPLHQPFSSLKWWVSYKCGCSVYWHGYPRWHQKLWHYL